MLQNDRYHQDCPSVFQEKLCLPSTNLSSDHIWTIEISYMINQEIKIFKIRKRSILSMSCNNWCNSRNCKTKNIRQVKFTYINKKRWHSKVVIRKMFGSHHPPTPKLFFNTSEVLGWRGGFFWNDCYDADVTHKAKES